MATLQHIGAIRNFDLARTSTVTRNGDEEVLFATSGGALACLKVQPLVVDGHPTVVMQPPRTIRALTVRTSPNGKFVAALVAKEQRASRRNLKESAIELAVYDNGARSMTLLGTDKVAATASEIVWAPTGDFIVVVSEDQIDVVRFNAGSVSDAAAAGDSAPASPTAPLEKKGSSKKLKKSGVLEHVVTDEKSYPFFTRGGLLGVVDVDAWGVEFWKLPETLSFEGSFARKKLSILDVTSVDNYVLVLYSDYSVGVNLIVTSTIVKVTLLTDIFPFDDSDSASQEFAALHAASNGKPHQFFLAVTNSPHVHLVVIDEFAKSAATISATLPANHSCKGLVWTEKFRHLLVCARATRSSDAEAEETEAATEGDAKESDGGDAAPKAKPGDDARGNIFAFIEPQPDEVAAAVAAAAATKLAVRKSSKRSLKSSPTAGAAESAGVSPEDSPDRSPSSPTAAAAVAEAAPLEAKPIAAPQAAVEKHAPRAAAPVREPVAAASTVSAPASAPASAAAAAAAPPSKSSGSATTLLVLGGVAAIAIGGVLLLRRSKQ